MSNETDRPALERVYAARNAAELNEAYDAWAATYDRKTLAMGYCLPFVVPAWVARHLPPGGAPVLDAGCGTGLSGPAMAALGYTNVEGLDLSAEMLAIAAGRKTYARLTRARLGDDLPYGTGHFAAVFSTGVFTEGHAPASGLIELARITRSGGPVIFTVRDSIFSTGGFGDVIAGLADSGIWIAVERSQPFRAFAAGEPDVTVTAFVYRVR